MAIDSDGLIRIEDVRPGTYMLRIRPLTARLVGAPLGVAQAVVVVPEFADGDLDRPLDIGTIKLIPAGR